MNIIVAGLGTVGKAIMEEVAGEGHNVVVIDRDSEKVEQAVNAYDVKGVIGNCASSSVLKEAGISFADIIIATTSHDELNILSCIIAKKLGAKKTIARASTPEYYELFETDGDLGLSLMINPKYETAMDISRMLRFPSAIKVNKFSEGKVELVEFRVNESSKLVGLSLKDLGKSFKSKVLIVAAQRSGKAVIPTGDFVIEREDRLFVTATSKNITQFFRELGWNKQARNVIIVGGTNTSLYLCKELMRYDIGVKLIEKDRSRCQYLSEVLKKTEIICGDGTDQELLTDEGINYTDAFVALGESDEQNIIMSMFASSRNVPKVITRLNQLSYYDMLQKSGIYSIVSDQTTTTDQIIRFVRTLESKEEGTVRRIFHIIDDTTEILEFVATERFKHFNVPISELKLKKNLLISGIVRGGNFIAPSGKDAILLGDDVIVVTLEEGLNNLNDILAGL